MKTLVVLALALLAAVSADPYPRYEEVVRSPSTYDLLYGSISGPHRENWYFTTRANLRSIIIPSQVANFCIGPSQNETYLEAVTLSLHEVKLASSAANVKTTLLASGSYNGELSYGQELEILLMHETSFLAPVVQPYSNPSTGYRYILEIAFNTTGVYPWYTSRALSSYSVVHAATNTAGIAVGLSYTL